MVLLETTTFRVNEEFRAMIDELKQATGRSQGQIIRDAIVREYRETFVLDDEE